MDRDFENNKSVVTAQAARLEGGFVASDLSSSRVFDLSPDELWDTADLIEADADGSPFKAEMLEHAEELRVMALFKLGD